MRIFRQPTIQLGILCVVEDVDHGRSAGAGRIVNSRVAVTRILAQLHGAGFRQFFHFRFRSEMQTSSGTGLDASRFEPYRYAVIAQRAFEDLPRGRTKFWDVERAPRYAIAATDAVRFLEIDDAVRILDNGGIRRTRRQTARIFT